VRRLPLAFAVAPQDQAGAPARAVRPSMALELAARASGASPLFAPDGRVTLAGYPVPSAVPLTLTLNFEGGADDIPTYSLADLHACLERGDAGYFRRQFEGKVVLFGTLLDTDDRRTTSKRFATGLERAGAPRCAHAMAPAAGQVARRTIAGVYIHATAVNNLLRREAVREVGRGATTLLAGAGAALAGGSALLFAPAAALGAWLVLAAGYVAGAVLLFRDGLALPLVEPLLGALGALALTVGWRFVVVDREERFLRRSFGLYLAPQVIDGMLESGRLPALGGEMREVTVFFSDIAGFSSFSETMSPTALVALMNEYLSAMTDIVEDCGGYVDKYIGDSIVAVFGAPAQDPEHARHAVQAALRCRERLAELNAGTPAFQGRRIGHRIGLNSGEALVGNIGSRRRFNYTVMSDAVNLASRLEGANKYFDTSILVADATVQRCGGAFAWREVDAVRVKGRAQPVRVYEPLAEAGAETTAQRAQAAAHAEGLAAWRTRDFERAAAAFERHAADDPPAARFAARARELAARPPGPGWEPVNTLEGK
jgi:adenylate cyclase